MHQSIWCSCTEQFALSSNFDRTHSDPWTSETVSRAAAEQFAAAPRRGVRQRGHRSRCGPSHACRDHTGHPRCSANLDGRTMGRPDLLLVVLLALTVPACRFTNRAPLITPDSEITWDWPSHDERIGWKLCVDEHPCVDLGPISARSSNDTTQTYRSHFWSQGVRPYLTPGTHTLAVVVYKLDNRAVESGRSAAMTVRVGARR